MDFQTNVICVASWPWCSPCGRELGVRRSNISLSNQYLLAIPAFPNCAGVDALLNEIEGRKRDQEDARPPPFLLIPSLCSRPGNYDRLAKGASTLPFQATDLEQGGVPRLHKRA